MSEKYYTANLTWDEFFERMNAYPYPFTLSDTPEDKTVCPFCMHTLTLRGFPKHLIGQHPEDVYRFRVGDIGVDRPLRIKLSKVKEVIDEIKDSGKSYKTEKGYENYLRRTLRGE